MGQKKSPKLSPGTTHLLFPLPCHWQPPWLNTNEISLIWLRYRFVFVLISWGQVKIERFKSICECLHDSYPALFIWSCHWVAFDAWERGHMMPAYWKICLFCVKCHVTSDKEGKGHELSSRRKRGDSHIMSANFGCWLFFSSINLLENPNPAATTPSQKSSHISREPSVVS